MYTEDALQRLEYAHDHRTFSEYLINRIKDGNAPVAIVTTKQPKKMVKK